MARQVAWSHTALEQFHNCPEQYHQVKVLKKYPFEETPENRWGNQVHKALEKRLLKKEALPGNMVQYEPLMQKLDRIPGRVFGEQQLAIKREGYAPVSWFDKDTWCRGIVDAMWLDGKIGLAVDYKTGKHKPASEQLTLFAALIFGHYPEVMTVHTKFVWLQHLDTPQQSTGRTFMRADVNKMWEQFIPAVERIEEAIKYDVWPKKKSGLCGWCPVIDCENWYDRHKKR